MLLLCQNACLQVLTGVIGDSPQHTVSAGEFLPQILEPLTSLNKCTASLILQDFAPELSPHLSKFLGIFIQNEHSPETRLPSFEFILCARELGHFFQLHLPSPAFSSLPFHSTTIIAGGC